MWDADFGLYFTCLHKTSKSGKSEIWPVWATCVFEESPGLAPASASQHMRSQTHMLWEVLVPFNPLPLTHIHLSLTTQAASTPGTLQRVPPERAPMATCVTLCQRWHCHVWDDDCAVWSDQVFGTRRQGWERPHDYSQLLGEPGVIQIKGVLELPRTYI